MEAPRISCRSMSAIKALFRLLRGFVVGFRHEIIKKETASFRCFTMRELNRPGEYRPVENKRVEFPVLSAGVDTAWKVVKKRCVEKASGEGLIQHLGVNAYRYRAEPFVYKCPG